MTSSLVPVPFDGLSSADLSVGRIYRGGPQPNVGADPLHPLVGVGNSGGFRVKSVKGSKRVAFCVLFTTGAITEWPDGWAGDGSFVYYGDQRVVGKEVLDTPRGGNRLLADVDAQIRRGAEGRRIAPPFLLFTKVGPASGRDVTFEGLLVPAPVSDWLKVEHLERGDGVLSNYRAVLRRLSVGEVSRPWLSDLVRGFPDSSSAPEAWREWVATGAVD